METRQEEGTYSLHMALNLKNKNKTKRKNKQNIKGTPNHFAFDLLRSLVSGKL